MSVLPIAAALQLAAACAPAVHPDTWLSVVHNESRFEPLAIGDNTGRIAYHPSSLSDAIATAARLIAAGHSLDLGIAQINSAAGHLQRRGLPLSAAFDPCTGFRVGGDVLADCYRRTAGPDEQARLMRSIGCYNTGSTERGAAYVVKVQASAAYVVPAIRLAGTAAPQSAQAIVPVPKALRRMLAMEDGLHGSAPASAAQPGGEGASQQNTTRKDVE